MSVSHTPAGAHGRAWIAENCHYSLSPSAPLPSSSPLSSPPFLPSLPFLHSQLLEMTCRLANALKASGVRRGDRVAIYMPVSPLAAAAMLACARIGAIHR